MRNDGPLWPERAAHYADNAMAIGNGCVPLALSSLLSLCPCCLSTGEIRFIVIELVIDRLGDG